MSRINLNQDHRILCAMAFVWVGMFSALLVAADDLPQPPREFRAAWVATVANIDWPSRSGLTDKEQQQELDRIVARAKALNLNALIFQVRPACDAVYESSLEPWSPYVTGTMGQGPGYDPLEYMIRTAHRHGIELHTWFNPYRALHKTFKGTVSGNHIQRRMPSAVKQYDGYLWLDPGNPAAAEHSLDVILDVVRRYDIDGVHLDDYFYPYPVRNDEGPVPFPDDDSFGDANTSLDRNDWRRQNIDHFVQQLYQRVKAAKPHVKVGISPFGIWRPGYPESIQGFDAYDSIYADARKWLHEGWVDYFTPQLYWKIDSSGQSYPTLLDWWIQENKKQVAIWPGNYASRVGMPEGSSWPADEILQQITLTRDRAGSQGNVLFSMKALFDMYGPLGSALREGPYREAALVPEMPNSSGLPEAPAARLTVARIGKRRWKFHSPSSHSAQAIVWTKSNEGEWQYHIHASAHLEVSADVGDTVAVSTLDRWGRMGSAQFITLAADPISVD